MFHVKRCTDDSNERQRQRQGELLFGASCWSGDPLAVRDAASVDPGECARPNVRGSRIPQLRPTPVRQAAGLAKYAPREAYGVSGYGESPDQPWGLQQPMLTFRTHSRLLVSETEKTHRRFRILREAPAADECRGNVRGRVFSGWSLSCWGAPLRQQAFPLAAPAASSNGDDSISGRGPRFRSGAPTAVIQAVDRPSSDLRVFGLDWNADREWRLKHISVRYCQEPTPRHHAGGTTAPSGMPDSGVFSDRCP